MISKAEREYTDDEVYSILTPPLRRWFREKFNTFTPSQRYAVKEIHEKKNVLISSPTGSGKTLSAFLSALNELFILAQRGELEDKIYVVYVSPLKALNNDIERNLNEPLREIYELERELPRIRVAVRTGDTSTLDRAKQTKKPPHILITTPETLAIVLNAPKFSKNLKDVRWIIVDEIHSLADNKRGVHLSLSLERLENICETKPVRIGLSATISPLDKVAEFLVGLNDDQVRDCLTVDVSYFKKTELKVISPVKDLIYTPSEKVSTELYKLLDRLLSRHKTTLIFTNTRSATERVTFHLKSVFKEKYENNIGAHHSSLSKGIRLDVEEKLKNGELKVVVTSTSLELGIDIGYIDLVILLGSPKSISRALQRVGRSGHKLKEKSKGHIIVLDRDDLVECVVLMKKARERALDKIKIPENALDVLAQHLVGMSIERKWSVEDAYRLIRRAYPYRNLSYDTFISLLRYLGGEYEELEDRRVYGKLWYDERKKEFGRRGKMVRAIYYMNVGTIPDEVSAKVFTREGKYVGKLEEEFIERLLPGDIFVLGGKTYIFRYSKGLNAYVDDAESKKPTVPAWFSEMLPLSYDLATEIQRFRGVMKQMLINSKRDEILDYLRKEYKIDKNTALAIYNYFLEQIRFSRIPTDKEIVVEQFIDDERKHNYIFHTLIGRRANNALARAFAYEITKRKLTNVAITISDNGFVISLPPNKKLFPDEIRRLFNWRELEYSLRKSLENTEMLKRRFRHVATRSFLILRRYMQRRMTVGRQQLNSHILYNVLRRVDPNFPVLREVYREIMEDAMNIEDAKEYLRKVSIGEIKVTVLDKSDVPSPFAFNLVVMGYSDTVLMEDRKEMIRQLHQKVMKVIEERR